MTATYPLARPSAFAANATNPLATLDSDLVNLTDTLNGLGNGVSVMATATITTTSITNANVTILTAATINPTGIANTAVVVITAGSMTGVLPAANGTVLTSNGTAWGPASFASTGFPASGPVTNSLVADVPLANTTIYFDGPSVAVGNVGTWYASGTVTLQDTNASSGVFDGKLWDGTTVIASARVRGDTSSGFATLSLSGWITSPTGNIRISAKDSTNLTNANIKSNASGNGKDSTVSAYRIL